MKYTKHELKKLGIENPSKIESLKSIPFGNTFLYEKEAVDAYVHEVFGVQGETRIRHVMFNKEEFDENEWIPQKEILTFFPFSVSRFYQLVKQPDCSRFKFGSLFVYQKSWMKRILNEPKMLKKIKQKELYKKINYDSFEEWSSAVDTW